jgi:hypothetical protein
MTEKLTSDYTTLSTSHLEYSQHLTLIQHKFKNALASQKLHSFDNKEVERYVLELIDLEARIEDGVGLGDECVCPIL